MKLVALEEHYIDDELLRLLGSPSNPMVERMRLWHHSRLADMDAAGIETQVLSHAPPGLQALEINAGTVAQAVNDRLHAFVAASPRFEAFASLPTIDPTAAARELERCVTQLGFRGAMINGVTAGRYSDDRHFWPIYEAAAALDVPIYIHPADLPAGAKDALISPYAGSHPMFAAAGWGFTVDAGTHAIRLVLSGLFETFPNLQIILGHLGEGIPFLLDRIDETLARNTPMKNFAEVFRRHFHVTTSGFFSSPALKCSIEQLGADRVMFSVDWPYANNGAAAAWFDTCPMDADLRRMIGSANAARLLKL